MNTDRSVRTSVAVVGNCTLKPLVDYLRTALPHRHIDADIWEAPFDQWANQMLDKASELYRREPSFIIVYLSSLGLTTAGTKEHFESIGILKDCVDAVKNSISTRVILILPEPLEEEYHASSKYYYWREHFTEEVKKCLREKVVFIDPISVIADMGRDKWFASRFWYHGKFPCHPDALIALGRRVAVTIANCTSSPVKVVVCDLDNTLWGGVVGEDGYENLLLDVHSLGGPYIRLQGFLKTLTEKGTLLVAVSKNNENDVREVFEKRGEMLLKWNDFTMIMANWRPKSENIVHAARALNLGLKEFCLIDDSPFEREEARASLPDIIVPELPSAPEDFVPFLAKSDLFHIPVQTDEDRNRAGYYRSQAERNTAMKESGNMDLFMRSLNIKVRCKKIDKENIERVIQLVNKTNQFNLTTRRYDHEQIKKFMVDTDVFAYCYGVTDVFGDSGITGVLIAVPRDGGNAYCIDIWLLSCRVMGRTVEKGIFRHLVEWLNSRGAGKIFGDYIPSSKNTPVENLYGELGFDLVEKRDKGVCRYERCLTKPYEDNKYVTLYK
jgi:FkbH-like protein